MTKMCPCARPLPLATLGSLQPMQAVVSGLILRATKGTASTSVLALLGTSKPGADSSLIPGAMPDKLPARYYPGRPRLTSDCVAVVSFKLFLFPAEAVLGTLAPPPLLPHGRTWPVNPTRGNDTSICPLVNHDDRQPASHFTANWPLPCL